MATDLSGLPSEQAAWLRGVMHGVFTVEQADAWLTTPDPLLGGKTPVEAVSDGDIGMVWTRLRAHQM